MCRLQVLEGAFKVPVGTWSNLNPTQGLMQAKSFMQDNHPRYDAGWTSSQDEGVYTASRRTVAKVYRKHALGHTDADDLMQRALMGVSVHADKEVTRPFYEVGGARKEQIRCGMTPATFVEESWVGKYLTRKAKDDIKVERHTDTVRKVPDVYSDEGLDQPLVTDMFLAILRTPAGSKEVLALLNNDGDRCLHYIISHLMGTGECMSNSDAAKALNMTKGGGQAQITRSWAKLATLVNEWNMPDTSPIANACV